MNSTVATFQAESFAEVLPGVFRWAAYSPAHKVELAAHAIISDRRLFVFDPIPLAETAWDALIHLAPPAAIVLTNENHERDAARWRELWKVPVWAAAGASLTLPGVHCFPRNEAIWEGWRLHRLEGGAGGETALRHSTRSLVVVGDAIVNLAGRGLELLPAKYCRDQAQLKRSLAALVKEPFAELVMAHGDPLTQSASDKISALL